MSDNRNDTLSRRDLLVSGAVTAAAGLALSTLGSKQVRAEAPKKGGTLRLGMAGGATTDSLDPATLTSHMPTNITWQLRNNLVEISPDGEAVPELAESWDAKAGARTWVFNLRKGVEFHNGKSLVAEDVVYSLNYHRGENSSSGAKGLVTSIVDIKADGTNQVVIELESGNADLPSLLSDYHLQIVPAGTTDFSDGQGTGGYQLQSFEPGVRGLTTRNPNYWKEGRAHVEAIETLGIADVAARTSALQTGQVDLINKVDPKTLGLLKRAKGVRILAAKGGRHLPFLMRTDTDPYTNNDLRLALKYAIDREQMLQTILRGYGQIGNDHPIPITDPFHAGDLPQRSYDPDKAAFHFKKAGMEGQEITIHTSDAAFEGAIDSAVLFKESASRAGISVNVQREPADGYWSSVWMQKPFCTSYWSGRPTADSMLSVAYKSDAAWNDTFWKRADFDQLLIDARAELDTQRRREMYHDLQKMIHDDGGAIIPVFADFLDAGRDHVKGYAGSPDGHLSGDRAGERVWLDS
ncbi:ABC transporter substrate-binding protein [Kiloniella laminariae]|uniref:ABC transporter substrate-binding protein n=1 Tax=Kiloniella laminariae TaxID=454162 RepID=A0ABT4LJA7_9PROT|nr:ABC transporter substrate-binding protein [Kiloniella laminariae]MCZ4281194.1 ABC transporter substrate-binding protein [Kiloniella laminariae]